MRLLMQWTTAALLLCALPTHAADAQRSTYHIAPDSNRLTGTTGSDPASFTHDANGNITAWSLGGHANTVTYDVMNRPARHMRNGVATHYEYDAFDRRVGKSSTTGGQQRFVYDGHRLLAEADSLGRWTNYVWLGNELVALIRGGQMYAVHTDHLGRPEVVTDAHKAVVWLAVYGAFDRKVLVDMIGGLNIGFPGQYHDLESGLAHNGRRDYVPEIGRYLQTDPIGLAGGLNTYAYAENNPVGIVDPDGLRGVGARPPTPPPNTQRTPQQLRLPLSYAPRGPASTAPHRAWQDASALGVSDRQRQDVLVARQAMVRRVACRQSPGGLGILRGPGVRKRHRPVEALFLPGFGVRDYGKRIEYGRAARGLSMSLRR